MFFSGENSAGYPDAGSTPDPFGPRNCVHCPFAHPEATITASGKKQDFMATVYPIRVLRPLRTAQFFLLAAAYCAAATPPATFQNAVQPLLTRTCAACHN